MVRVRHIDALYAVDDMLAAGLKSNYTACFASGQLG